MKHTITTIFPKIDIHCHLIPSVDDGCKNFEEFEQNIQPILESEIKEIVCTPHFEAIIDNPNIYNNYKHVEEVLHQYNIKTYLGFEFKLNYQNINLLKQLIFDNKFKEYKYLLVELDYELSLKDEQIIELMDELMDLGYKIVLAHPEKYINHRKIKFIETLMNNGVVIQCDASSFIKKKTDKKTYKFVYKMLDKGLIHIVASDYHNLETRNYSNLNIAFDKIAKRISLTAARALFYDNPKYILNNFIKKSEPVVISQTSIE